MFILLLRHGIAEERDGKPDAARELTEVGHKRMKQIARGLTRFLPKAEAIISSPLVRAKQTAEWVSKAYDLPVELSDALAPGHDWRELLPNLTVQRAILVGHEPTLSAFMLALTGMSGAIELKKGGCYGVRVDGDAAHLEWMLPPRVMRR